MKTNAIPWIIFFLLIFLVVNFYVLSGKRGIEISYSKFMEYVERGYVKEVVIKGKDLEGEFKKGIAIEGGREVKRFKTVLPFDNSEEFVKELMDKGVEVKAKGGGIVRDIIVGLLPWLILFGLFWFLMSRGVSPSSRVFEFSRSRAKIITEDRPSVTFDDVAGVEEAKEELKEVIEFLKNPDKFRRLGARIPKGILLVGPPGSGKTLLARAVAGEAGVPFLSISGSDFVEMFVGVGAARVRDLFNLARRNRPCIVFIDEIDAVGRLRGAGLGGGHDEREHTLNQLLVEMDGFDASEGIVVLAATNRPDILDPALLRPGRFDKKIVVNLPDVKGREKILEIHTKKVPLADDVDLKKIAQMTPGFSGADLANLVNEAALIAARKGKDKVDFKDFEEAKDKIILGLARKSFIISDEEKRRIAYHEAGHALVSYMLPGADPIHKITIIPHGRALGGVLQMPKEDRYLYTRDYLEKKLSILLAGREAEKIVFGDISTGAVDDLKKANEIARRMVCEWGMSEKLGPMVSDYQNENVFLGRDFVVKKPISEELAKMIDDEVKEIIKKAEERAREIIEKHRDKLDKLAKTLLEKETIMGEEVKEILCSS